MKLYFINADNGDGSSTTRFYDSKECIDFICDQDNGFEEFWDGDGGSWGSMNIEVLNGYPVITGIAVDSMTDLLREQAERNDF